MGELCGNCFAEKPWSGACPSCGYDPAADEGKYPMALRPGTILSGRYVLGRVLGQGGFGITYNALDQLTQMRVAVKEYLPTEFAGRVQGTNAVQPYSGARQDNFEYGKQQFLDEAKTLVQLIGNEHIVRIDNYFEEHGTAYLVTEYIDGLSLEKYVRERGGRLSVEEANELLLPVMEALDWVHEKGLVHRDIAPDNIMITQNRTAKLIDFGAARYSTGEKSKSLDVILKHGFAPKEQYSRHSRQGSFTDVYAMAATYYYTITGQIPPDSIDRLENDALIAPSMFGVDINVISEEVLLRALAVLPNARYQSTGEVAAALRAANPPVNKGSWEAYPEEPELPTEPEYRSYAAGNKRRGFAAIAIAAAAVLAVVAAVCILALGKPRATRNAEERINAIGTVTLESKDAILEARAAYDDLTEKERKKLENGDVLEEAEKAIVLCGWDDVLEKVGGKWRSITSKGKSLSFTADKAFAGIFKEDSGKNETWTVNGGEEHWKEADKIVLDLGKRTLEMKKEGEYDILFDKKNENVYVRSDDYEKYYEEHFKLVELNSSNINDIVGSSADYVQYEADNTLTHEVFEDVISGETKCKKQKYTVTVSKLYEQGWILISEENIKYRVENEDTYILDGDETNKITYVTNETLFCGYSGGNWVTEDDFTIISDFTRCIEASGKAVFVNADYVDRVEYDDHSNSHTVYMTNGASFYVESEYHTKNYYEY